MHFLCHLLLLAAPLGLVSAAQAEAENYGAAIWEHEGRETSTLITIHLRLMCAAGAWWFPHPPAPTCLKRSPTIQIRWSVGLITLRPRRSSTIDFPWPSFWHGLGKASLGSIERIDTARRAALHAAATTSDYPVSPPAVLSFGQCGPDWHTCNNNDVCKSTNHMSRGQ